MNDAARDRFDALVQDAIDALPPPLRALLDEIPLVVLDRPTPRMLKDVGMEGDQSGDLLCGLHSGTALTERSVERSADLPSNIHIFREGIIDLAGGWGVGGADADDEVYEQIRITLLHELGHHFGLDEDDLERLGYD